jgi:hypothetical protein
VPKHIAQEAESIARQRRKSGQDVQWSAIIREALDAHFPAKTKE